MSFIPQFPWSPVKRRCFPSRVTHAFSVHSVLTPWKSWLSNELVLLCTVRNSFSCSFGLYQNSPPKVVGWKWWPQSLIVFVNKSVFQWETYIGKFWHSYWSVNKKIIKWFTVWKLKTAFNDKLIAVMVFILKVVKILFYNMTTKTPL